MYVYIERALCCFTAALLLVALVIDGFTGAGVPAEETAEGSSNISPFYKWMDVLARYDAEENALLPEKLLVSLRAEDTYTQVVRVHLLINESIRYVPDSENWEQSDYWATLQEALEKGGDCEEYAIAKYMILRALEFPEDSLRIVIVHDLHFDSVHAILQVSIDGEEYYLDNNHFRIVTHGMYEKLYRPHYAINATRWWRLSTS